MAFDSVTAGAGDLSLSLSRFPNPRVDASDLGGDFLLFLPPTLARSVRFAVFTKTWARIFKVRTLRYAVFRATLETDRIMQESWGILKDVQIPEYLSLL